MRWWILGAATLIAACGSAPDEPAANREAPGPNRAALDTPPTPEALAAIPTRFVGLWDIDAAACRAPQPGAQRLRVGVDRLTLGQQKLPTQGIAAADAGAVNVDVVLDRDGITTQRRWRLSLAEGGALLLDGEGQAVRRIRCDAPAGAEAATRNAVALTLAPDGLAAVAGASSRPIPFGSPAEVVLRVAEAAMQALPERSRNADCGEGPLDVASYPRIRLYFQEDRFAGWAARGRGLTTMAGVGIGSTRREVDSVIVAPVSDTSLGREFTSGGLSGIYDAKGVVTDLWAGRACIAR